MLETTDFHGWRFKVEPEKTRAAYTSSKNQGAEDCSCAYCRNLLAQRDIEYPQEMRRFLDSVGVDPFKEAEVWEVGPLEECYTYNAGWWHFIGEVEIVGETPIRLVTESAGRAKEWEIVFLPGQASLKLAELPVAPLVQVEFSVKLPWVLEEAYPWV